MTEKIVLKSLVCNLCNQVVIKKFTSHDDETHLGEDK